MSSITATAKTSASTPELSNELPLFLQDGGEDTLAVLRKELEVFTKLLTDAPRSLLPKTLITLNPYCVVPDEVGEEEATAIQTWWDTDATRRKVFEFLFRKETTGKPHKVNGKFGEWSAGFMGSRWADCEINGRNCRIAFYSRKTNPSSFTEERMDKKYNYALIIDPTL